MDTHEQELAARNLASCHAADMRKDFANVVLRL
jgi:hypothetical protein